MSHPLVTLSDMRILHTSDWHLGRNFHGVHLLDAQLDVLESLVEVVKTESVDVVVVAGDIYDRAVPAADAVAGLSELLEAIRGAGAKIVGISGNHDSAVRVGFAEQVLSAGGVTLRGDVAAAGQPVILTDRDGQEPVAFYPIPYLEPETARHVLGVPEARSHERLLRVALDRARSDANGRPDMASVAIVHAFVTGGQECESELALSVGGSAEVSLRCLNGFDYVALGHLHGSQVLGGGKARYSGSPLPYSFSERTHIKGAWLIELSGGRAAKVESVPFPVRKPLFQLSGTLETLLSDTSFANAESGFVQAILTNPLLPLEAMAKLRRRFPHAVLLTHEPPVSAIAPASYSARVKAASNDLELATAFVSHVAGRPATKEEIAELRAAMDDRSLADSDRAVA